MACQVCDIIEGKFEVEEIYGDDKVRAVLHPSPAFPGQILLFPLKHWPIVEQVPDFIINHIFKVANKLSVGIFETLGVQGTNIVVQNGVAAGQQVPHFCVEIIPRKEGDEVGLQWEPKKADEGGMADLEGKIKEETKEIHPDLFEKKEKKVEAVEVKEKPKKISKEEDYLLRQLRRIP